MGRSSVQTGDFAPPMETFPPTNKQQLNETTIQLQHGTMNSGLLHPACIGKGHPHEVSGRYNIKPELRHRFGNEIQIHDSFRAVRSGFNNEQRLQKPKQKSNHNNKCKKTFTIDDILRNDDVDDDVKASVNNVYGEEVGICKEEVVHGSDLGATLHSGGDQMFFCGSPQFNKAAYPHEAGTRLQEAGIRTRTQEAGTRLHEAGNRAVLSFGRTSLVSSVPVLGGGGMEYNNVNHPFHFLSGTQH